MGARAVEGFFGRWIALLVVLSSLLALPAVALGACDKDTDCKGVRVCEDGRCVQPLGAGGPAGAERSLLPGVGDTLLGGRGSFSYDTKGQSETIWILGVASLAYFVHEHVYFEFDLGGRYRETSSKWEPTDESFGVVTGFATGGQIPLSPRIAFIADAYVGYILTGERVLSVRGVSDSLGGSPRYTAFESPPTEMLLRHSLYLNPRVGVRYAISDNFLVDLTIGYYYQKYVEPSGLDSLHALPISIGFVGVL